jgi:hypothetical protein
VSFKLMSALLQHDYQSHEHDYQRHGDKARGTPGLNQQNFRAFEDILAGLYCHARGAVKSNKKSAKKKANSDWNEVEKIGRDQVHSDFEAWKKNKKALMEDPVTLQYENLPPVLKDMLPSSASDLDCFEYSLSQRSDKSELPDVLPAKPANMKIAKISGASSSR